MNAESRTLQNLRRLAESKPSAHDDESEVVDDLGCYGKLRGMASKAIMLELIDGGGKSTAFGYPYLVQVDWDPSGGIKLRFTVAEVLIVGRNLRVIKDGILAHRIQWVRSAPIIEDDGEAEATAVYEIKFLRTLSES